jgi:hypothetical protein
VERLPASPVRISAFTRHGWEGEWFRYGRDDTPLVVQFESLAQSDWHRTCRGHLGMICCSELPSLGSFLHEPGSGFGGIFAEMDLHKVLLK